MEELLIEDKKHMDQVGQFIFDEAKQRDLNVEDEEEDFLDEGEYSFLQFFTVDNFPNLYQIEIHFQQA